MAPALHGVVAPGFEPVRAAFAANFVRTGPYGEIGASLAVYRHGACVVDLWGGHADRQRTSNWTRDTLVNLWSTTKGAAALCVALLVDRGQLAYADRVARYWPDFAAAGKGDVTLAQLLSHQAGLPGFAVPTTIDELFDQPLVAARLAAQAPLWPPGSANGYHAVTFGVLVAEIVRRVDGRTLGRLLAEDLAGPLGADFHIGLAPDDTPRVAELVPPDHPADMSGIEITPAMAMALGSPAMEPQRANEPAWRAAELPALNGHGSAQGIARLYAALASPDGAEGIAPIGAATVAAMTASVTARPDLVLGFDPGWGMGVAHNGTGMFGPDPATFGHSGWGGSFGCANRATGIAIGYACNHMGPDLVGDPRATSLCDAVFRAALSRPR
jgi:CubicO group peptidase (beta-lactamase class C family)